MYYHYEDLLFLYNMTGLISLALPPHTNDILVRNQIYHDSVSSVVHALLKYIAAIQPIHNIHPIHLQVKTLYNEVSEASLLAFPSINQVIKYMFQRQAIFLYHLTLLSTNHLPHHWHIHPLCITMHCLLVLYIPVELT